MNAVFGSKEKQINELENVVTHLRKTLLTFHLTLAVKNLSLLEFSERFPVFILKEN